MASRIQELVTRLIARDDASKVIENVADELEALEKQGDTAITIGAEDKASDDIRSVSDKLAALSDEDKTVVLKAKVADAERDVSRLLRSLSRVDQMDQKEIDIRVNALGDARAELDQVQDELRQLDGETATVHVESTGIDELTDKLGALPGALGGIGDALAPLAAGGAAGPVAGAAAIAAGLLAAVEQAKDLALEAGVTAQLTGDTVENVSKVQQIWRTTGADVNDLNDIVVQLNGALQQSPELAAQLGINLEDGKSALDRFVQVVDLTDQGLLSMTEQSALFGEEGIRQVAALTRSYDDLADTVAGMEPPVTEKDAQNAQNLDKALKEVNAEFQKLAVQLGQSIVPLLTDLVELAEQVKLPTILETGTSKVSQFTDSLELAKDSLHALVTEDVHGVAGGIERGAEAAARLAIETARVEAGLERKQEQAAREAQARQGLAISNLQAYATVQGEVADLWRQVPEAVEDAVRKQQEFNRQVDEGKVSAGEMMDEFDAQRIETATTALGDFLAVRQPGVTWLDQLGETKEEFGDIFEQIKKNKGIIPDIFKTGAPRAREFRDAIGEASDSVNQQLLEALENADGKFQTVRERARELREEMIEKIEIQTGLDMDVPEEKEKILGLVNAVVPTKRQVEVGIALAKDDLLKLKADLAIEQLQALLPATALQLKVDLAEGEITPEEAAATAQEILDAQGVHIDMDVNPNKAQQGIIEFASAEQERLNGRPLYQPVLALPPDDADLEAVSIAAQDYYDSQPPVTLPVVPRITAADLIYGSGTGSATGGTLSATATAAPAAVAPTATLPPIKIEVAMPKVPSVTINTAVVGDPFDVARTVDKAQRRFLRFNPRNP